MRAALGLLALLASPALAQEGLPSGQPIVLWQVLSERIEGQGTQTVLRFIAPDIARDGGRIGPDAAFADMDWLCDSHGAVIAALPTVQTTSVIITLMDRPVPRGVADQAATQYFGSYVLENGKCLPEELQE